MHPDKVDLDGFGHGLWGVAYGLDKHIYIYISRGQLLDAAPFWQRID